MEPCRWRIEHKTERTVTSWGDVRVKTRVRWVCECGKATHWYVDEHRADRARDRHALDGQQRFGL